MSQVLHQISRSSFSKEIENSDPPWRFVRPAFVIYNEKSDLVEHVSHFNHSTTLYARNEAFKCKVFLFSLGPTSIRWFNTLDKGTIHSYEGLKKTFSSRFETRNWIPELSTPF